MQTEQRELDDFFTKKRKTKTIPAVKKKKKTVIVISDDDNDTQVCPLCDDVIQKPFSERINKYLKGLEISVLKDLKGVIEQAEFCLLHKGEARIIPKGTDNNYPSNINFDNLSKRVEKLLPEIKSIIKKKITSSFLDEELDVISKVGQRKSKNPMLMINRFESFQVK